jgi:hypothetical protein
MKRRDFIAGLGATAAWPISAHAQQPAKLPTIGFLGTTTPSVWSNYVPAFVQRLRELGWVEGRTVAIEYRWAEGRNERFGEIAAELAVWPRAWRGPAATSRACRCWLPISPASGLKICGRFCPMFADWPFWEMPAIPPPWLKWSTFRRQLASSDLRR